MKPDRRVTLHSGRIAHLSLRGSCAADAFVAGEPLTVTVPLADLCDAPSGARDRQVVMGDRFLVIDRRDGWAFGQADRGGYCGWVAETALGPAAKVTHWVAVPATHFYPQPRVQARAGDSLTLGARLAVTGQTGSWLETPQGFVPAVHLRRLADPAPDPVAVAEALIGSPYLWGGNSRGGLDCSALVQAAWIACGWDCPGDSDLQQALGPEVDGPARRGDLVFWRGHVAIVTGPDRIIHANGHTMNVAHEGLAAAIARIAAAGGGPHHLRRDPRVTQGPG